jgi:hypothetical protein
MAAHQTKTNITNTRLLPKPSLRKRLQGPLRRSARLLDKTSRIHEQSRSKAPNSNSPIKKACHFSSHYAKTNSKPRYLNVHPLLRKLKIENGSDREKPQISLFQQSRLKSDHKHLLRAHLVKKVKNASATIRLMRLITGEGKEHGPKNTLNKMSEPGYGSRERESVGAILATKHGPCFREQELPNNTPRYETV